MEDRMLDRALFVRARVDAAEREHIAAPASGVLMDAWHRLRKNRAAVLSLLILILILLFALLALSLIHI